MINSKINDAHDGWHITVQGFKVQRFKVDGESEPLSAEKPNRLHAPFASLVHKAWKWFCLVPPAAGEITAGRGGSDRHV